MELQTIVERYAEAIESLDPNLPSPGANARSGATYRPGFKVYAEGKAVGLIDDEWERLHPGERAVHKTNVPYGKTLPRARIDHILTTGATSGVDEWGLEAKRLEHVGDNGKVNGYAVPKTLSPYLADRGLLHDALRLRDHGWTQRLAVIAWAFDYDSASIATMRSKHAADPSALLVVDEVEKVVRKNGGRFVTRPLIEFVDAIMSLRGLTTGVRAEAPFEAWTHPAGGRGVVYGWEVRSVRTYDPRHPW